MSEKRMERMNYNMSGKGDNQTYIVNIVICYDNEVEVVTYAREVERQSVFEKIALVVVVNKYGNKGQSYLIEELSKLGIEFYICHPKKNLGYLNGLVYGYQYICAKKAGVEWFVLSNTDIILPQEKFFETFIRREYLDNQSIWLVGPSVFAPVQSHYSNPYLKNRPLKRTYERLNFMFSFPHLFNLLYKIKHKLCGYRSPENYDQSSIVYGIHGSYMFLRREFLEMLIQNKEWEFMYDEEPYLAEIALQNGKFVYYDSQLLVHHMEGTSTGKVDIRRRCRMMKKSTQRMLREFY